MTGFEIRAARTLQHAGFLELVEEDVRTPDGDDITRFVVRHPGAVVVVPFDDDDRIVMVRQYRVAARAHLLEVPAGKREAGEEPQVTAARELAEEVGLRADRLLPLAGFYNSPGFCDEFSHVYLAEDLERDDRVFEGKAEERDMTIERLSLDEALRLVASREIVDAKTVIGVALAALRRQGQFEGASLG